MRTTFNRRLSQEQNPLDRHTILAADFVGTVGTERASICSWLTRILQAFRQSRQGLASRRLRIAPQQNSLENRKNSLDSMKI